MLFPGSADKTIWAMNERVITCKQMEIHLWFLIIVCRIIHLQSRNEVSEVLLWFSVAFKVSLFFGRVLA